jgi:hypothetical protein
VLRSLGAVIAGYLVFGVSAALLFAISGRPAEQWPGWPFAVFATVYGAVFAALAGALAGALAPRAPFRHAGAVSILLVTAAVVSWLAQGGAISPWSQLATIFAFAPAALAGASVRGRRR